MWAQRHVYSTDEKSMQNKMCQMDQSRLKSISKMWRKHVQTDASTFGCTADRLDVYNYNNMYVLIITFFC